MKRFVQGSALAAVIALSIMVAGCEEDSGAGEPTGDWPDSVKPIVGWFATQRDYLDTSWGSLYYFDGSSVTEVQPLGENAFKVGSMAGPDVAWATDWHALFEVHGAEWRSFPAQPECPHDHDVWIAGAAVFGGGEGYVSCEWSKVVLSWVNGEWSSEAIPDWSADRGADLQCVAKENCLAWNPADLSLFDGEGFVHLPHLDSLDSSATPALWPNRDISIMVWESESDTLYRLWRYADSEWTIDPRFTNPDKWFRTPVMTRLGDALVISHGVEGDEDFGTQVLAGDEFVNPGWPYFRYMAFAPGGGGLAVDDNARVVYWVDGLDLKLIYEFSDDEAPSGFLVVADKE
jgi:hypothetical protein